MNLTEAIILCSILSISSIHNPLLEKEATVVIAKNKRVLKGIRFHGEPKDLKNGFFEIEIYVNGQETPIGSARIGEEYLPISGLVDRAFHEFVKRGDFGKVKSPARRRALRIGQREYSASVPWNKLTYRFLPVKEHYNDDNYFIFTTDKSDVRERETEKLCARA